MGGVIQRVNGTRPSGVSLAIDLPTEVSLGAELVQPVFKPYLIPVDRLARRLADIRREVEETSVLLRQQDPALLECLPHRSEAIRLAVLMPIWRVWRGNPLVVLGQHSAGKDVRRGERRRRTHAVQQEELVARREDHDARARAGHVWRRGHCAVSPSCPAWKALAHERVGDVVGL